MANEIAPQEKTAQEAVNTAESATATVQPETSSSSQEATTTKVEDSNAGKDEKSVEEKEVADASSKSETKEGTEAKVTDELKATRRRAQLAEQEAKNLRARLDEVEKKQTGQQQNANGKAPDPEKVPELSDYETLDEYTEAKVLYRLEQKRKEQEIAKQKEQEANRIGEVNRKFNNRLQKFMDNYPDYTEIVSSSQINLHESVIEAIKESEVGPAIAYHLAKNEEDLEKISKMNNFSAIREIGKLEAKITSNVPQPKIKQKQVTQAPEPIKPVNNLTTPEKKDYNTMPISEYMKVRNSETFLKVGNRLQPKK